jgi:putative tricarboxylic transport membrane protein
MNYDILATIIFIIFATVMAFQSIKLGLGTFHDPGPGFLPIFSTLIIGILALIHLVCQVRRGTTNKKLEFKLGPHWQKAFYLMVLSFIYVLILWDRLGYIIGTTLWLVVIFRIGGIHSWKKNLIATITTVMISYLLLEKVANCFLPKGIFGF